MTIFNVVEGVRRAAQGYCSPGKRLNYPLLLAWPSPSVAIHSNPVRQIGIFTTTRRVKGGGVPKPNTRGMPESVPALPNVRYSFPEAFGRLGNWTILSSNAYTHLLMLSVSSQWENCFMPRLLSVHCIEQQTQDVMS